MLFLLKIFWNILVCQLRISEYERKGIPTEIRNTVSDRSPTYDTFADCISSCGCGWIIFYKRPLFLTPTLDFLKVQLREKCHNKKIPSAHIFSSQVMGKFLIKMTSTHIQCAGMNSSAQETTPQAVFCWPSQSHYLPRMHWI